MSDFTSLISWNVAWSAMLAVAVFLLGRWPAFRCRPALLHVLWFGVLLRLIVPSVVELPLLPETVRKAPVETAAASPVFNDRTGHVIPVNEPALTTPRPHSTLTSTGHSWPWSLLLFSVSLAGSFGMCLQWGRRAYRLRELVANGAAAPEAFLAQAKSLTRQMRLSRCPDVVLVDNLASPAVVWIWRRVRLLIPCHLVGELDEHQWSCVIAHELAHLARGDVWFNLVGSAVLTMFWWNPVAWWAWREMRVCQEASCDALALAKVPASRRRYAETLLQVVDSWQFPNVLKSQAGLGFGDRSVLTRRFEMIANEFVRAKATMPVLACLGLLSFTFFCMPVSAEKKENSPTAEELKAVKAKLTQLLEDVNVLIARQDAASVTTDGKHRAQKAVSSDHIKTIMLAMHYYENQNRAFPPAKLYGKNNQGGAHPHSWRVALLPYLDQQKLYDSYQFDEPWDSPANLRILEQVPSVYQDLQGDQNTVNTAYFVLVGKLMDDNSKPMQLQTAFSSKKGLELRNCYDGTSNTLAVVETARGGNSAIPWTKPEDIAYDPTAKLPEFGGFYPDGFYVGLADGSSLFISTKISESSIKKLITPAAGEVNDLINLVK